MAAPPDWSRLEPHRPLGVEDTSAYVEPPGSASQQIAGRILAGVSPILLIGPAGVGKSTELNHAAYQLKAKSVACVVNLDRSENMRTITPERALYRIAGKVAWIALEHLKLKLSHDMLGHLVAAKVLEPKWTPAAVVGGPGPAKDVALSVLREVKRLAYRHHVTLLIDGLEKSEEAQARGVFDALSELSETAQLAVIVPWHAAYGPGAHTVITPGEQLIYARPVSTRAGREIKPEAKAFFRDLLLRRVSLQDLVAYPVEFLDVIDLAIEWSGGIPRTFLQLVQHAASYARLNRNADWPALADVEDAARDQRDSFRRLLGPGDTDALRAAEDTDGRELDLSRKIRLLSHGILFEVLETGQPTMRVHPLVRPLLTHQGHA